MSSSRVPAPAELVLAVVGPSEEAVARPSGARPQDSGGRAGCGHQQEEDQVK